MWGFLSLILLVFEAFANDCKINSEKILTEEFYRASKIIEGHEWQFGKISALATSPKGDLLAIATADGIQILDVETGKPRLIKNVTPYTVTIMRFHPTKSLLVVGDSGGLVNFLSLKVGVIDNNRRIVEKTDLEPVIEIHFSEDGWIYTAGEHQTITKFHVRQVLSAKDGEFLHVKTEVLETKKSPLLRYDFARFLKNDEVLFAQDFFPGTMNIVRPGFKRTNDQFLDYDPLTAMTPINDLKQVYLVSNEVGTVTFWDATTKTFFNWKTTIPSRDGNTFKIKALALSQNQKYILAAGVDFKYQKDKLQYLMQPGIRIAVLDAVSGKLIKTWKEIESASDSTLFLKPGQAEIPVYLSPDSKSLWAPLYVRGTTKLFKFDIETLVVFALGPSNSN